MDDYIEQVDVRFHDGKWWVSVIRPGDAAQELDRSWTKRQRAWDFADGLCTAHLPAAAARNAPLELRATKRNGQYDERLSKSYSNDDPTIPG